MKQQARLNMHMQHPDLENGQWRACNYDDLSSDNSFVSAKYHSYEDGTRDMFYERDSQSSQRALVPLSGLAGILKTKEVYHLYSAGDSFGSGKFGIIKLV